MTPFDHYHELAAQLLGKETIPLPLPNWDRDYPHNIGLLSDAEESALAAAVLQLTNGMSYESWKTLDMGQRIPWMEQAAKKVGTDKRSDGVTRATVIAELTSRAQAGITIVTADEVAVWPNGLLDQFLVDGILTPTANAQSIVCDACNDDHVESVQFVEAPAGSPLRAYITCPDNGRVQVPMRRLRCWQVNMKNLGSEVPKFKFPENVTIEVKHSTDFLPTPRADDPKGLRNAADYCRAQAAKLGDVSAKWWWIQAQLFDQQADQSELQNEPRELQTGQIPHSLAVAHRAAIVALLSAVKFYKSTVRFANSGPVLDAVERFVHELRLVPMWYRELQRRSTLIAERCQAGSSYDVLRQKALAAHSSIPATLSGAKFALEGLRTEGTRLPHLLQVVAAVRRHTERILDEPPDGMSAAGIAAYKAWRDECRAIQLQAERIHVDGCWFLVQLYEAGESDPPETAKAAKAILQSNIGGGQLEDVQAAVESMFAWAIENQPPIAPSEPAGTSEIVHPAAINDEPLNERGQLVLVAMQELNAVDSDTRCTTEAIAVRAFGNGTDSNALKSVMSELKTREYVLSKTGRGGGCWLTPKGQERATKLRGK